jgi:hypothetical protein
LSGPVSSSLRGGQADRCAIRKKSGIQNAIQYIGIELNQDSNILYENGKIFKNIDFLRKPHVSVIGNTIIGARFNSNVGEFGGIKIGAADRVTISGNTIKWSRFANGIFLRARATGEAYYRTSARNVNIVGNNIDSCLVGVRLLTTSTKYHEDITIANNRIQNCQRGFINVDTDTAASHSKSVKGLFILSNQMYEMNLEDTTGISAIRVHRPAGDLILRGNVLRSTTRQPSDYNVSVTSPPI